MNPGGTRGRIENLLRRSWTNTPNAFLRAMSLVFGAVVDLRNAAWSVGLASTVRAPLPVISVGGLTVGGSGKTPISADLARHLASSGARVAILTAGPGDETTLHSTWNREIIVLGGRDREALTRQAASKGATVALLDSGFQHLRLERDLDVVTILVDYAGARFRLPAGPFRERWAAIDRADAVVLVRRHASPEAAASIATGLSHAFPTLFIAEAEIIPTSVEPASEAARTINDPSPNVAVAGVMWPESFFVTVSNLGLNPEHCLALPDHAVFDRATVERIIAVAGSRGVVCTEKDAGKLTAALPGDTPIWHVEERVAWGSGGSELLAAVRCVASMGTGRQATAL